ncbi:MAG: amidohydrolase family protein [Rhizobiales bacterium]|nr:amidohydrolase family protein [Hyphomicrobiales bacterium]
MSIHSRPLRTCAAPLPVAHGPAFAMPKGACDSHAQIVGPHERYLMVTTRNYTPPPAAEPDFLAMHDALGIERGVLVQISVYGTDNRCMLATLRAHPERLRGIAAVGPDITDRELETLADSGVRGVRINTQLGGDIAIEAMGRMAHRVAGLGWHIELLMDVRALPGVATRIARLPVEVVFEHMGWAFTPAGPVEPGFQALLAMMREGRAWTKLSGPYLFSSTGAPYADVRPFAQALLEAAPERCLWGTDWPHVSVPGPMVRTEDMLGLLPEWAEDEGLRTRVLVDNPAWLYGFAPIGAA